MAEKTAISFIFLSAASILLGTSLLFDKKKKFSATTMLIAILFITISYTIMKVVVYNSELTQITEEVLIKTLIIWMLTLFIKRLFNKWATLVLLGMNMIVCAYLILKGMNEWLPFIATVLMIPFLFFCSFFTSSFIKGKSFREIFP